MTSKLHSSLPTRNLSLSLSKPIKLHTSSMADEAFEPFQIMNLFSTSSPTHPHLSLSTPPPPLSHHAFSSDHHHRHRHVSGNNKFRSLVPLGPFTGYASILKHSRFLNPAQQLLQDFCGGSVGFNGSDPPRILDYFNGKVRDQISGVVGDRIELHFKYSSLSIMLDEVYKRCKLYCQQMELVVASFETIEGIENAAPYISIAMKAVLRHFSCLKNAILDKLDVKGKGAVGGFSIIEDEVRGVSTRGGSVPSHQDMTSNFNLSEIRSQRGLPESAVSVMRTWLFDHFLHPYPSDSEKQMLAQQTGLSRTQVSNWFINSRVRLWKPMVEEIHSLETQQSPMLSVSDASRRGTPSLDSYSLESSLYSGNLPQNKRSRTNNHFDMSKKSETRSDAAAHENITRNYLAMNSHEGEVSLALSLQAKK